ncbi:MAG: UDP pyrophosphate synthase [Cryomorphaceae bacterium BACL29 MAG-121220-bin8]|jgi:undecaprenyl diphosphate synthase|nr:MAG: UDP pyrophosphate synthase [Cryomorphaceae bacterium BACL29 MAG-121220-bin8]|tara:strand:- start:10967 stop:11698 length:732 start_codon:yes stop_codon:yes gene_type:complete
MIEEILKSQLPNHVAIIMDGNGRWAKDKNKQRVFGHENGVKSVKDCISGVLNLGIQNLTLYVFSLENWKRPKFEVKALMHLLVKSLENELESLIKENIKLTVIGDFESLNPNTREKLNEVISKTSGNNKLNLNLAISYGSRQELVNAIRAISNKVKNNIISDENIDENIINEHLYTRNLPSVDLLIRTGGEYRISNFLLWQIAYAELFFTNILWPDFRKEDFFKAIIEYQNRERRFGKISEQK